MTSAINGHFIACKCFEELAEAIDGSYEKEDDTGSLYCHQVANGPKSVCETLALGSKYCQQADDERKDDFKTCCGKISRIASCFERKD